MNLNNKSKRARLFKSISNVKRTENVIDVRKEQMIIQKLEQKLGKPKDEVRRMMTDGLMSLLTIVPFNR